jgi:capsular polysaccharide biosynthesis protein
MELTEAVQRIVRHHIVLIVALAAVGMLIPLGLNRGREPSYQAVARVEIDASSTSDPEQAKSREDTANAIITSPGNVGFALEKEGIDRDPKDVADNHVAVESIGTSSVLELSVTDHDPRTAMLMTNALADQLVRVRDAAVLGASKAQVKDFDDQIKVSDEQLRNLRAGGIKESEQAELSDASRQRSDLVAARSQIIVGMPPEPTVVDQATVPDKSLATGMKAQMAVGGLLGLALGLALASVVEALRPTIVSPDALARELSAPIVGRLPRAPQQAKSLGDPSLPVYLQLAAVGAGVDAVHLVPVGPPVDLQRLTRWLQAAIGPSPDIEAIDLHSAAGTSSLSSNALIPVGGDQPAPVGLVVVAPSVLPKKDLTSIEHLVAMTQWPLIGIITYQRRRFARSVPPDDLAAPPVRRAVASTSSSSKSASAS